MMSSQAESPADAKTRLRPDVKFAMGVACLLGILAVSATNTVIDLDLFHQMALFREFLAQGMMPASDPFAYTPTRETVVHHEWGMGAIQYYAMVGSGLGNTGLMILKYLLTFATCLICFHIARKQGAPFELIILMAPVALSVGGYIGFTNVRAQVMTLLFVAIQFWMFTCDREGKRIWVFAWIPMMIAWTNIHGGVVAGIAIYFFWSGCRFADAVFNSGWKAALSEGRHRIGLAVSLPFLMCVNPWGAAYIPYLFRAVSMKRPMIGEWSSIWGSGDMALLTMFTLAIFVVAITAFALFQQSENRRKAFEFVFPVFAIALTWIMTSKNMRHASIFAVTWICYAPMLMSRTPFQLWIRESLFRNQDVMKKASWGVAMLALAISLNAKFWSVNVPAHPSDGPPGAPVYPVHAVDFIQSNEIEGNMMVWFNDGAYVSWHLHPNVKVSLDSRYEVAYPHGAVEESVAFFNADRDWKSILQKYPTDLVLAPSTTAIVHVMKTEIENGTLGWEVLYSDESFTLFRKLDRLAFLAK